MEETPADGRFRPLAGISYNGCSERPTSVATSFRPLNGDGTAFCVFANITEPVFAPLRGWYTKYITEYRKMEELNA